MDGKTGKSSDAGALCADRSRSAATKATLHRAFIASVLLLTSGCLGARGDIELVEARLRQQEDLNNRYSRDLLAAERERDQARHEADLLRRQIAEGGQQGIPAEFAQSLFAVHSIEFNTLMSGGRDRDGQPGDDVLVAVFVPRDENGDVVKLPGAIELEAVDLSRPEAERQVGKWTFTADESRKLWRSGTFNSGYKLELPLAQDKVADKVILHAKLSTADGRQFNATHTIKLNRGDATAIKTATAPSNSAGSAVINADGERPGRATVTPIDHVETQPVSASRSPRPQPLSEASQSPTVPVPSADAFTPPPVDVGNPFADESNPFADPGAGSTAPATSEAPADSSTVNKPAPVETPAPTDSQARPFPDGTKTSDRFTDETIPFLR